MPGYVSSRISEVIFRANHGGVISSKFLGLENKSQAFVVEIGSF
jgi:hypothetical protein